MERRVSFILIAGDLFHINVPDLAIVDRAAAKLREVKDAGIPVYVWYGSHDYSPTEKSIIDVLASSGLFTKVARFDPTEEGTGPRLAWTTDERTGAAMVAISGKALGLDRHVFADLDKESFGAKSGFRIFGYHAAVKEFLPDYLAHIDSLSVKDFPGGFDYYAGGHIHHTTIERPNGGAPFVNPGPTFGSDGRDVLNEEPRGFVMVTVKGAKVDVAFERVDVCPFVRREVDVSGLTSAQARTEIEAVVSAMEVDGKAIVLRVKGELASGRRAELDLDALHTSLPKAGARAVHIVKAFAVSEAQGAAAAAAGAPQEEIERRVLSKRVEAFASSDPRFAGAAGLELALTLKRALSEEAHIQRGGKTEYEDRLRQRALELMGMFETVKPTGVQPPKPPPKPGDAPTKSLEEFA